MSVLILLLLTACEPLTTARIDLPLTPADVTAIAIWVSDVETREIVASTTIAPTLESVELGVPAERQLEFSLLARTAQPGPAALGGLMPGWVGRARARIPLGREQVVLPITAHPAGVLTVIPKLAMDRRVRIRLAAESTDPPVEVELAPDAPRVLPMRTGRYRVTVAEQDEERAVIVGGDGLFVARRVESIGVVEVEDRAPPLPPEAVRRIEIVLADREGDPIELPIRTSTSTRMAAFRVRLEAFDAAGMRATSDAAVTIELESVPRSLIATGRFTAAALPAISPVVTVRGRGRISISARALISDDGERTRTLHDEVRTNVIPPGVEPGMPSRLDLELLGDEEELIRGARASAELIDSSGLFAQAASGMIDFGGSDPWLFFPNGPSAEVTPGDGGHLIRDVARPSGPRGLFVVLRAVFTSTAVAGTLTASVALPVLESRE